MKNSTPIYFCYTYLLQISILPCQETGETAGRSFGVILTLMLPGATIVPSLASCESRNDPDIVAFICGSTQRNFIYTFTQVYFYLQRKKEKLVKLQRVERILHKKLSRYMFFKKQYHTIRPEKNIPFFLNKFVQCTRGNYIAITYVGSTIISLTFAQIQQRQITLKIVGYHFSS